MRHEEPLSFLYMLGAARWGVMSYKRLEDNSRWIGTHLLRHTILSITSAHERGSPSASFYAYLPWRPNTHNSQHTLTSGDPSYQPRSTVRTPCDTKYALHCNLVTGAQPLTYPPNPQFIPDFLLVPSLTIASDTQERTHTVRREPIHCPAFTSERVCVVWTVGVCGRSTFTCLSCACVVLGELIFFFFFLFARGRHGKFGIAIDYSFYLLTLNNVQSFVVYRVQTVRISWCGRLG
jgi:hypothetical protein